MTLLAVTTHGEVTELRQADRARILEVLQGLWDAQPRNEADHGLTPVMAYLKHCLKRGRRDECRRLALECEPVSAEEFNLVGLAHEAAGNAALGG